MAKYNDIMIKQNASSYQRLSGDLTHSHRSLTAAEVWVEDVRRYVVCLNVDQAKKDRLDREAVIASLREALKGGDKSLVGKSTTSDLLLLKSSQAGPSRLGLRQV